MFLLQQYALISQAGAQVETVVFPALIARAPRTLDGALRRIARVEVGGLHFVVGEDAQTARLAQTYLSHQRLSDPHFIPALLRGALARLPSAGDLHGYCVTGLPASWALQPALCRQLAERLREGTTLYIKVRVIPEPLGLVYAVLLSPAGELIGDPTLSSGRVLVVDLGYHTVDVAILDQLFPVRERLRTVELGLAHALGEIQQQLSAVFGRPYSLFEIDQAVRTGVVKVAGALRPLPQGWDRPLLVLADQVASALVEAAGSAAQYDAVLLGGGGAEQERLAAAITRRFAHAQVVAGAQTAIARVCSAAEGRFLLAEVLEWLHFPSWRERYKRQATRNQPYAPCSHIYERLAALRDYGLVSTIERSVDLARREFTRLPAAYMLLQAGAELLAAGHAYPVEELHWESPRKRSLQNVEHSVAIGTFYAALRCAATFHGKQMLGWRGDHLLRDPQSYDRVRVSGQREPLPVQPDATLLLEGRRYFLELDRNTRPLVTWHEKALAYHAYRGSTALRTRYGVDDFVLLCSTLSERRAQRIAEQVVKVTRGDDGRYLLLDAANVHPIRIRANWLAIAQTRREMQRVVNRLVEVYHPTLAPTALWQAPAVQSQ